MKLLVLSDLHVEFEPFVPNEDAVRAADVVVLAGDVDKASTAMEWVARTFAAKPVIYVAGNHEFYSHHWDVALRVLRGEAQRLGIHFLENDDVVLDGVRFLGCSLWTDFRIFGEDLQAQAMKDYEHGLNDCHLISAGVGHDGVAPTARRLTAQDVLRRHEASREWLRRRLSAGHAGRTVVVTHHLPSAASVAERYRTDRFTPGFASDLPAELLCSADLWVHGHTHESSDYTLESRGRKVRVLCNPRGYPRVVRGRFENPAFRSDLLVEV